MFIHILDKVSVEKRIESETNISICMNVSTTKLMFPSSSSLNAERKVNTLYIFFGLWLKVVFLFELKFFLSKSLQTVWTKTFVKYW